jgi:cytochrome c biogenesis protein CcmG/thiol:disulfide interchange protein DsbE
VKRWIALAPVLVLAALVAVFAFYGLRRDPEVIPDALVGQPLPPVAVRSLQDGQPTTLGALKGRPMLVNIFGSWCGTCILEHPELVRLQSQGVRIVGVAHRDTPEKANAFLARHGDPYEASFIDDSGRLMIDLGMSGTPESFLVDAEGRVVAKWGPISGPLTPEVLAAWRSVNAR